MACTFSDGDAVLAIVNALHKVITNELSMTSALKVNCIQCGHNG